MKYVIAMIQPHRLNDVKQALFDNEIYSMTVSNALGCGNQMGYTETYRGVMQEVNLLKKVRLEIAVNDDFVEPTIEAIIKGSRSGSMGDGKIFVLDLPQCIRIRTLERGTKAI
ncbi:MAG: P-II family nitrogen regulator [Deltaproteobacteria bacterium]|nr:MAG: P-II family nitrogen regulator [Deltaproteobacteria bacterium]